jgi:hypothetical protein
VKQGGTSTSFPQAPSMLEVSTLDEFL